MRPIILLALFLFYYSTGLRAQDAAMDSIKYHFNLGLEKSGAGEVKAATAEFLAAQKIAEATNNLAMLCKIQVGLGKVATISENNNDLENAISKGSFYCSACKDTLSLARILLQKGVLKIKQNQLDSATLILQNSATYYLIAKDTMGAANAIAKVGNILEEQGQYAAATPYYQRFYEATLKDPESPRSLTANIYLTGNYLYLGKPDKASFHNNIVQKLSQKLGANYEYAQSLRYEALIDHNMGKDAEAFNAFSKYVDYYQDTLLNKQRMEETAQLKAEYENEKKENQIALQAVQIRQEQLKSQVLVAGLLLAILVGALLFILTRRLRKSNQEKEMLIKEVHHRVKNNLQILSSLLSLQSRQITDESALDAIREGQSRVDAMGLIHQKLYMGDHVAQVEMKSYLEHLGQNMLDSFGVEKDRIVIENKVEELHLDVDTAIPLGLIINELVTNSLKYGFPGEQSGVITIALWKNQQDQLCLKVADNGIGREQARPDDKSTGFGTRLVQMLSKKLKGMPEVQPQDKGFATQIVFEKFA